MLIRQNYNMSVSFWTVTPSSVVFLYDRGCASPEPLRKWRLQSQLKASKTFLFCFLFEGKSVEEMCQFIYFTEPSDRKSLLPEISQVKSPLFI